MSMYRYIEQKYREETPQQVNATADGGSGTTPSTATMENIEARYGLFPYGNEVGFTKLNEMMDADGLDSQQRYDVQQKWFKNQENYINSLPEVERAEWNKVLDEIKASDNVLKAYSTLGAKAESIGTGVARMQAGTDEVGARVLSHLDKTDGELENEIAAEHSDAYARYKVAKQNLDQMRLNSFDNPMLLADGSKLEDHLSKEDQESLAWFNSLLTKKRADTMHSEDANFLVKDALRAKAHNTARANQKSQYAGAEERRAAIKRAGKGEGVIGEVVETAKAAWNDPNAALDVAFESTGANLLPQLVGIAAGLITRSPMVYQFISSIGQAPSEIQGAIQETLQEKYQEKYGKSDLSKITPEELEAIYKENAKELNDSFNSGVRNAAIIAAVEPLVAKGVGKVAAGFTKLSSSAKSKTLKALGISGAAAAKFTGEGWEEAFGQIATNLADGKPWAEGVGSSFVMALLGVENIPNTVAVSKDVKNQLRDELGLGKSDSKSDENKTDKAEDTTDKGQTTQSQSNPTSNPTSHPLSVQGEGELYQQYRDLLEQLNTGAITESEFNQRSEEVKAKFNQERVDPTTGEITVTNTFDEKKVYQPLGEQNENRNNNNDGSADANGTITEPGVDEPNTSGTQRSSEISEPVSPIETETSTTGSSQSNEGSPTDIIEQPNDNPAEGSTTGVSGRTGETVGSGLEQGELGAEGSQQNSEPTETTQLGSENSGVQQRSQSDSSRETLKAIKAVDEGLVNSTSVYEDRPKQKVVDNDFEFFSGGVSNGPVVWGTMSSNLAYGYGRKGGQNVDVYKPKNTDIRYVVFDGQGRNFSELEKRLNTMALRANGFGTKNSDKVVGVLALENKYDAVILRNYRDLGGIIKGARNVEHSDSVVILNKDKFDKVSYKAKDFPAYSNGFTIDTTGLETITPDELITLAKTQRSKFRGDKNNEIKPTNSGDKESVYSNTDAVVDTDNQRENATTRTDQVSEVTSAAIGGKRNNQKPVKLKEGHQQLVAPLGIVKDDSEWVKGSNVLQSEGNYILDDGKFWSAKDISRTMTKPPQVVGVNPLQSFGLDLVGAVQPKSEKTLEKEAESKKVAQEKADKMKADAEQVVAALRGDKDKLKQTVERNNDKLRRMNEAMAEPKLKYANDFKGSDLRANQKVAHSLIKDNPNDVDAIREAFMGATPSARPSSFEAAKRGYVKFSVNNPNHKAFKGSKVDLEGFDFDGNPVYKRENDFLDELEDQHTVDSQTTLTLAAQPTTARKVQEQAVRQFFKDPTNRKVEGEMREAVEEFAKEHDILEDDGGTLLGTDENLATFANHQDFIAWVGDKLRPFFKKLNQLVAGVIAVVSVGAMTVPNDAVAHQGYATYTQGETIQGVSTEASNTINWVKQSKDHQGKNFVVADKDAGTIHIVSPEGKLLNTQHAIYGKGKGNDRSAMNTPSGRMQLQKATDLNATEKGLYGDSVLDLVDPTTKSKVRQTDGKIVAMHRVINKPERKAALQTATANDNYLSHGCINIPTAFYDSAVDSLDGAMVYVLDHKKPAKQVAKVKSSPTVSGSGLLNYKPKKLFSTSAFKDAGTLPNGLTKDKASKHLQKALGEHADNIFLVSREDYKIPNGGAERLIANGVEGFYHADTGAVVIIADSIQAQDGLSAEERLAWVGWHELYHRGLDVKLGNDLSVTLNQADGNAFIAELASAIQDDRAENNLTEVTREKAVEEALAELGAAIATGKLDALTKRYGLTVPNTFTQEDSFLTKLWDSLKQLYRKITGNKDLTDRQVKALLGEAITSAQPEKIEREMADELLAAYADDNSPMAVSAMFSVSKNLGRLGEKIRQNEQVQSIIDLMSNNDAGNTGHSPNTDQTRSSTVRRKGKQTVHDWIFERIQDSRIKLGRVDEQGEGGKLYRSVANMSNRTQQKVRQMEKKFKNLEYAMMQFADTHRNIFKKASDKKQVDVIVQDVTTALRALTGGNEVIRKNLQEALGGKDYFDEHGNLEYHQPGLVERVENYRTMINNRAEMGLPHSAYMARELERLTRQLNDTLAIQAKFDTSNDIILQPNADKNERKDWHGHNGFTLAEAHAKLKLYAGKGLIDKDVLEGLEPETYVVKQYTGQVNEDGSLAFVVVQHRSFNAEDVAKNFSGEIKALVDQYAEVSKDLHNYTVDQLGERIAGSKNTAKWETSTMGKVREIYTTNEVDKDGNPIAQQYVIENPNSIDEIVTLQKAAEYSGHRTGRAFTGGSALEQLAWRTQMTAMQSSAKEVGQEMYDMYERGKTDDIRVYNIGDKDYALQKGIVLEVPDKANNGKAQYNPDGSVKTKVVKVSFKDNELNAALFGDNIKGGVNSREISTAGLLLRMLPMAVSKLTKFASMGLTSSVGFGLPNAYKGLKEKHNQLLAWSKDSSWVKSLPADKQALFDGVGGNTKLHAMLIAHTAKNGLAKFKAREFASIAFATKLINKQDLYKTNLTDSTLEEYNKLLAIYERGGISSRVEDLLASTHNKKLQFAMGGKANKYLGYAMSVLENISLVTMSQELVSTLMMTDFLENNLGMDAQMAADANLHFMNFDKRGASALANYLRKYTMFANAIAQGSRAFVRSYFEVDKEGKLHPSKQAGVRLVRNTAIGVITHSLAMMLAEHKCPEKSGSMNQVGDLNPYQLMREIPISSGCDSYWRFPVEYGAGMVENMFGVSLVQMFRGNWSPAQAGGAIVDTLKDNASPLGLPIGETDNIFGSVLLNLIYPFTPEPFRDWTLAFGGIDDFGNPINSKWAGSKEYKPTAGKLTTDEAWFDMAGSLYQKGFNVTPEEARAAVLGPFEGIPRQLLTWFIEKDPKVSAYDAILGTKSVYREGKDKATVAYTVVMNNLEHRYRDLHNYYIQAQGKDKTNPTDKWLADNGIELDADEKKVLGFITEYRTRMKKTKLSQEQRYEINMDFLRKLKTVTHPEG